jgi:hypothetical protein
MLINMKIGDLLHNEPSKPVIRISNPNHFTIKKDGVIVKIRLPIKLPLKENSDEELTDTEDTYDFSTPLVRCSSNQSTISVTSTGTQTE